MTLVVQGLNIASPINPLNAELHPICHLLALLEAHHILQVSRIRVKKEKLELYVRLVNQHELLVALTLFSKPLSRIKCKVLS